MRSMRALPGAAQLDFHYLEPAGGRYPLRNFPNLVNLKCHETNSLRPISLI
jgi:hypothetical protein